MIGLYEFEQRHFILMSLYSMFPTSCRTAGKLPTGGGTDSMLRISCKTPLPLSNRPNQPSLTRPLQDRLAQPAGTLEVGVHDGFKFLHHAQAALHFGDDAVLFG